MIIHDACKYIYLARLLKCAEILTITYTFLFLGEVQNRLECDERLLNQSQPTVDSKVEDIGREIYQPFHWQKWRQRLGKC